jgi:hypothetical protein
MKSDLAFLFGSRGKQLANGRKELRDLRVVRIRAALEL